MIDTDDSAGKHGTTGRDGTGGADDTGGGADDVGGGADDTGGGADVTRAGAVDNTRAGVNTGTDDTTGAGGGSVD